MLQILTPTGGRSLAWALCQRWLSRQTYSGPVRWIVVDDVDPPQAVTLERPGWEIMSVRPEPRWRPGQLTQGRNLLAGLEHVDASVPVVFWEDDDYYRPDWLEVVAAASRRAEIVGESRAHYYHVGTRRWLQYQNDTHASLCATAMRGAAIAHFREVVALRSRLFQDNARQYFDATIWRAHASRYLFEGAHVIGMKGIPGERGGIGVGHTGRFGRFHDPDGQKLRELCGADAEAYLPFGQTGRRVA